MEPVVSAASPATPKRFSQMSRGGTPPTAKFSPLQQLGLDDDYDTSTPFVMEGSAPAIITDSESAPVHSGAGPQLAATLSSHDEQHDAIASLTGAVHPAQPAGAGGGTSASFVAESDVTHGPDAPRVYSRKNNFSFLDTLTNTHPPAFNASGQQPVDARFALPRAETITTDHRHPPSLNGLIANMNVHEAVPDKVPDADATTAPPSISAGEQPVDVRVVHDKNKEPFLLAPLDDGLRAAAHVEGVITHHFADVADVAPASNAINDVSGSPLGPVSDTALACSDVTPNDSDAITSIPNPVLALPETSPIERYPSVEVLSNSPTRTPSPPVSASPSETIPAPNKAHVFARAALPSFESPHPQLAPVAHISNTVPPVQAEVAAPQRSVSQQFTPPPVLTFASPPMPASVSTSALRASYESALPADRSSDPARPLTSAPISAPASAPKQPAEEVEIVLIDDSDEEDIAPVKTTMTGPVPPKRPRSPQVIDLDDDDQLRSLSSLLPAHQARNVRPRHTVQGLPLPGAAGIQGASRIQVSSGGGLFSIDPEGTVNIVDSDDEAELQAQHRIVNTAQGIAALPPGHVAQPGMEPEFDAPFRVLREQMKQDFDDPASQVAMQSNASLTGITEAGSSADPSASLSMAPVQRRNVEHFKRVMASMMENAQRSQGQVDDSLTQNAGVSTQPTANGTLAEPQFDDLSPIRDIELRWHKDKPGEESAALPRPANGMFSDADVNGSAASEGWHGGSAAADHQNMSVTQGRLDVTRTISFGSAHRQRGEARREFIAIPSPGAARPQPAENPPPMLVNNGPVGPSAERVHSQNENAQEQDGLTERGLRTLMKQNEITADATEEAETPDGLNVTLMPHQKRALAWMAKREKPMNADEDIVAVEEECLGGILADDQGLGKTLTMIALLLQSAPAGTQDSDDDDTERLSSDKSSLSDEEFVDDSSLGERTSMPWRTLIVCPPSLINQWKEELLTRIKESHRPTICIYHGAKRERSLTMLKKYDVVLTTYATLVNEYPKVLKKHPEFKTRKAEKLKLPCRSKGPLCRMTWTRIVLDESQYVKNRSTESWNAVMSLDAEKRWCLSGTPIQNCVDDLYALFCFIRYHFCKNYEMWNNRWKKKLESPFEQVRTRTFKQFQAITGVVLLRRTKVDEINGKPLIDLPPRTTEVRELQFDEGDESSFYRAVAAKTVIRFNKFLAEGSISANYSNILLMLLRLRQASSHPFLIQYAQMQGRGEINRELDPRFATTYTAEELEEAMELATCGHSLLELLDEGVREMMATFLGPLAKDHVAPTSFLCSFCGNGSFWVHGFALPCGEVICSPCRAKVQRHGQCLRCRSSIAGRDSPETFINVDHLRREVHAQVMLGSSVGANVTAAEFKVLLQEEVERRRRGECHNRIGDHDTMNDDASDDVAIGEFKRRSLRDGETTGQTQRVTEPDNVLRTQRRSEHSKKKLLQALSQHSTKIRVIIDELNNIRERGEGEKTLVFSQWTSMLDIVEFHARVNGHGICRLDGSMTVTARQVQIQEFRESTTKNVFLISLHAGGTGLNLTASNRVILCDVWWNPAVEEQAIDRAHRIGQTKPVHVVRFRMKDTVEDNIYKLCDKKRSMANGTLGEKGKQNFGRTKLAQHELMSLFSGAAADVARNAGGDDAAAEAARNILESL